MHQNKSKIEIGIRGEGRDSCLPPEEENEEDKFYCNR